MANVRDLINGDESLDPEIEAALSDQLESASTNPAVCGCDAIRIMIREELALAGRQPKRTRTKADGTPKASRKPSKYNAHMKDCIAQRKADYPDEPHRPDRWDKCIATWHAKKRGAPV